MGNTLLSATEGYFILFPSARQDTESPDPDLQALYMKFFI